MTFTDEFRQLLRSAPQLCLNSTNVENCPYGDFMFNCQNCYICFETGGSSNGMYLDSCMKTTSCVDCSFARHSELCYQCLNITNCYNCDYCIDCTNVSECKHCFDCSNCNNCYGSVGLRHKEYHIYNEAVSKEEYAERVKEPFDQARYEALVNAHPHQNLHLVNCEDCVGDYIQSGKNCYGCFDINNMQDCMYYTYGNYNAADKDCCDVDNGSGNELCYQCFSLGYSYNCNFCAFSGSCKEEYFEKVATIKAEIATRNEYNFDTLLAL